MPEYTYKFGDLLPPIETVLTDAAGIPLDLDGCTVLLRLKRAYPDYALEVDATLGTAPGAVSYTLAEGDLPYPGDYRGEWVVLDAEETPRTLPNDGYFLLTVWPSLAIPPEEPTP